MTWHRDAGRVIQTGKGLGGGQRELIGSGGQKANCSRVLKGERTPLGAGVERELGRAALQFTWLRIRPLLWSNNGGVQRQRRSALGARRAPHHLSRMLGGLCPDAGRSAAAPAPQPSARSARPGLAAPALAPSVHRGERSGWSRRDAFGGRRPLTSLGRPAGAGPEPGASPARRPAHGPPAPAAARREDRAEGGSRLKDRDGRARRSSGCQHGSHKPGEPVAQRPEEPPLPSAGACQHP